MPASDNKKTLLPVNDENIPAKEQIYSQKKSKICPFYYAPEELKAATNDIEQAKEYHPPPFIEYSIF